MRPRGDKDVLSERVARNEQQRDFIERGLAIRNEARHTGEYYDAKTMHAELQRMFARIPR